MEENKGDIYILGVGHNTIVIIDLVETCGYNVAGLYHYNDSRTGEHYFGYPILGSFTDLYSKRNLSGMKFVLSQGDNKIRSEAFDSIERLGGYLPTIIHPSAVVSRFSILGRGVLVHANAVIDPDTKIGNNCIISFNAGIGHTTNVGNHCYLSPYAMLGAFTTVEDYVFIGIHGATISGKVDIIGEKSIIGAGSIVNKSVEKNSIMIGIPAKKYIQKDK